QRGAPGGAKITLETPFEVSSGRIATGRNDLTFTGPGQLHGTLEVFGYVGDNDKVVEFSGILSGPGGPTMLDAKDVFDLGLFGNDVRVTLAGDKANTYTGTTTVNGGTLFLKKPDGVNAIAGPLVIGDNEGRPASAVVGLGAHYQLIGVAVTINN